MMKVALISPKGNMFGRNNRLVSFLENSKYMESFKTLWTGPNLGLLTISALFPNDWECEYIDENRIPINFNNDYDIVLISAMTQQAQRAYEIAKIFRNKGILTVMGGIHATVMSEEASQHVDVVFVGEGEALWSDFIRDFHDGNLQKIYIDANKGRYDLKLSPIPRYDLLKNYQYPLITIQTTRGCPHDCCFCAASKIFGASYRRKSNKQILQEINEISKLYPGTLILFADDNAFVNRRETKKLLKAMMGMNLRWIAQTDISIATDKELLELMVMAGCQWIVIGFESVSENSLHDLDAKNWKLGQINKYKESIKIIQDYGIGVYGTFIVGLDNDEIDIFEATSNFILENMLYGANITVPTPLPGTLLREKLLYEDRILEKDWSYYTLWDIVISPKRMTFEELEDGLIDLYYRINTSISAEKRLIYLRQLVKNRRKFEAVNRKEGHGGY